MQTLPWPSHTSPTPKMRAERMSSCHEAWQIMLRTMVCDSTAWSRG